MTCYGRLPLAGGYVAWSTLTPLILPMVSAIQKFRVIYARLMDVTGRVVISGYTHHPCFVCTGALLKLRQVKLASGCLRYIYVDTLLFVRTAPLSDR